MKQKSDRCKDAVAANNDDASTTSPIIDQPPQQQRMMMKQKSDRCKGAVAANNDDDASTTSPIMIDQPPQQQRMMMMVPREVRNIIAGGMAGIVAKTVIAPLNRIKILFQVSSSEFRIKGVALVAKAIATQEGYGSLWKGNTATLIRVFPYSGIQFMVYDRKYFLVKVS
jgi:hypothetical protein